MAENKITEIGLAMKEVESLRLQLAEFFCEDPATFQLEECFKIFQNFCSKFRAAVNENERRRVMDEQKLIREKQQLEKRARQGTYLLMLFFVCENGVIIIKNLWVKQLVKLELQYQIRIQVKCWT